MFSPESIILYICLGSFVGIIAGLLGIGGGVILVPALSSIFIMQGVIPEANIMHLALGTSMATIVVTSSSSLRAHHKKKGVLWDLFKLMTPGIIIGALLATFIGSFLSSFDLAIIFIIVMIFVSFKMFFNGKKESSKEMFPPKVQATAGFFIGLISALVSLGGGVINVPYFLWQNIEPKKAIGTSAALTFPLALSGTIGYIINGWSFTSLEHLSLGFVLVPVFLIVSFFSFIFAPLGVKLAYTLPINIIKKVFACLIILVSVKMLISFV